MCRCLFSGETKSGLVLALKVNLKSKYKRIHTFVCCSLDFCVQHSNGKVFIRVQCGKVSHVLIRDTKLRLGDMEGDNKYCDNQMEFFNIDIYHNFCSAQI